MNLTTILSRATILLLLGVYALWTPSLFAQTGDADIDNLIYYYDARGGNNAAPTSLQLSQYNGYWGYCASAAAPLWEANCPSDLTYTPGSNGGYQAYGVGITELPAGNQYYYDCYWHWYVDYDGNVIFDWWCDIYLVASWPDETYGVAGAKIMWSQYQASDVTGSFPLSTVALKGAASHVGYSQFDCNSGQQWFQYWATRPCQPGLSDRYIVPYAGGSGVGYEDKILIMDPTCPYNRDRTDDSSDRNNGCFTAYDTDWYTDLPGAYRDTTFRDHGDSPGLNYFVPGVGTTQPASLQEGVVYQWRRSFWTLGLDNARGTIRHRGAVTVRDAISYPCFGTSNDAMCQFNVDQTGIGPNATVY